MIAANFFVEGIGKKVLLLLSILVGYSVILLPILVLDALTGINLVDEPMVLAGRRIDLLIPFGLAGAILSSLIYLVALRRLQKAVQDSQQMIELNLNSNSNEKPQP